MQYVVRVTKSLKSSVFLNLCLLLEAAMNESLGNVAADTNLPKAERAAGERLKWRASQILAPLTGSVDWSPYILTLGAVFFNKIQKIFPKFRRNPILNKQNGTYGFLASPNSKSLVVWLVK